jgi:two-component system nitrate/nitrite response regulator NarL
MNENIAGNAFRQAAAQMYYAMNDTSNPTKIRVLLVDDHPVVRIGIRAYLTRSGRVEVVSEAANGLEAIAMAGELHPDVVLMDTLMPRMNGLVAAKTLTQNVPGIKVVMHSVHDGREYIFQVLRSGARGYVPKNGAMDEFLRAVERVNDGETYFDSEIARIAFEEYSQNLKDTDERKIADLSCRELEVLSKIAEGRSTRDIATELGIGVRTVETHRERVMQKLNIHSVAGLTRFAIASGVAAVE